MNEPMIQLLVLAGIAVFLILRLKSVLGTREGFEKPPVQQQPEAHKSRRDFEVIEGGPDHDITDHVPEDSELAQTLAAMKRVEPGFSVTEFVQGARGAYEMIVMGFEKGNLDEIQPFLSEEVFESFVAGVAAREDQGLTIEAEFIGVRETTLTDVKFDKDTNQAEITMKFVGELTSVVRDRGGDIVEGSPNTVKRQKDSWTFARVMGKDDPNWLLVATDA
ncbi:MULTISPECIES: Tim44/TimA family putative adaptor protein [Ruegeria]|uniref:Tim44/TimA family putative adaptor protein n=1 Tax=Ruegeria atlantica TaxID=81569 RepID=A0AA90YUR7_9RHOB|nr:MULTISPECIES: Tim44/TimA family putative adaptor protein [Ruegeria]MCA0908107.1 Tim44/TimA family putative adaptor protein [Ruegeria marisrubri]NOC45770.1 Tim44/TimA family putative adaptor protein [Ruegeria sp. HKCCD7559]NOC84691.1 Tim44/TimA family putative adaptor protein [Ruegeria sp. HKCCD6428]NOC93691.1 Tim44/TimA family putative adaptor protein [Ruegeria sp. HKCCD6604]NOD31705.1 Tim44/TimA family putative adaptor protein [Ruegeria atlantica]